MLEKKKEKSLRFLIPVDTLPQGRAGKGLYDDILNEFVESGLKYAEVKDLGRHAATVTYLLKKRIKDRRIENVIVRQRSKKVYLERVE